MQMLLEISSKRSERAGSLLCLASLLHNILLRCNFLCVEPTWVEPLRPNLSSWLLLGQKFREKGPLKTTDITRLEISTYFNSCCGYKASLRHKVQSPAKPIMSKGCWATLYATKCLACSTTPNAKMNQTLCGIQYLLCLLLVEFFSP